MQALLLPSKVILGLLIGVIVLGLSDGKESRRGRVSRTLHDESDRYPDLNAESPLPPVSSRRSSSSPPMVPRLGANETDCPVEFQRKCTCKYEFDLLYPNIKRIEYFLVNCTNAGFTNASMLEFLPTQTAKLIFVGNRVPVLEPNVFGMRDYPKLQYIDMSDNHIEEIKGKAFHHVSTVKLLKLTNNNISNDSIHDHSRVFSNFVNLQALFLDNAFNDEIWSLSDLAGIFEESNLTKLEKLHLESNEIEIIRDPKLFCDLVSLKELYLSNNHLSDLNIDPDCLQKLNYVNLANNQIRTIRPNYALFGLLSKVNNQGEELRLDLSRNPFNCDCELKDFIQWLKNKTNDSPDRLYHREQWICQDGLPHRNIGLHLTNVNNTLCQVVQISNIQTVTTTLVWILSFIVIVLVLALLYFQRQAVFRGVQPLLQSAVHGVQYTSIDKQEQAEIAHV